MSDELRGEKIDVIKLGTRVGARSSSNALQPAKVLDVELFEDEGVALVTVPDHQLSLAIGREGQNVRLAARLTGWRLDITSEAEAAEARERYLAERADRTGGLVEGAAEEEAAVAVEGEPAAVADIDDDLLRKLEEFKREMFENVGVVPQRMCVGCRERFAQKALRRFVRRTDGWAADGRQRADGRGAYLCSHKCAQRVAKNKRYPGLSREALVQW